MLENEQIMDEPVITENYDDDCVQTIILDNFSSNIFIGASSLVGKRQNQQDSVDTDDDYDYMDSGKAIAVLCDGMGGLSGGELASRLCATIVREDFHNKSDDVSIPEFLKSVINKADEAVKQLTDESGKPLKAGTTLVCTVIDGGDLYWASVGDSRIYLIRGNEFLQVTEDHNYLMTLMESVNRGAMPLEEAENHPKREALISFIGIGGVRYISMNTKPFKLMDGDVILMCSDGLYRALSEEEMSQIVYQYSDDLQYAAEGLTNYAVGKDLPGQDNTSVVVLKYEESR